MARLGPSWWRRKNSPFPRSCSPGGGRQRRVPRGAAFLSRWSDSTVVVFHPLVPSPWISPAALSGPPLVPQKQKGSRRGRVCGFNHKLCRQPSPSALIPQTSCAPHSGRSLRERKLPGPGHLAPPLPCPRPGPQIPSWRWQPLPKSSARRRGRRGGPRRRALLFCPRRRLPAYMAPSVPWSPARKDCLPRRRQSPSSPRN